MFDLKRESKRGKKEGKEVNQIKSNQIKSNQIKSRSHPEKEGIRRREPNKEEVCPARESQVCFCFSPVRRCRLTTLSRRWCLC